MRNSINLICLTFLSLCPDLKSMDLQTEDVSNKSVFTNIYSDNDDYNIEFIPHHDYDSFELPGTTSNVYALLYTINAQVCTEAFKLINTILIHALDNEHFVKTLNICLQVESQNSSFIKQIRQLLPLTWDDVNAGKLNDLGIDTLFEHLLKLIVMSLRQKNSNVELALQNLMQDCISYSKCNNLCAMGIDIVFKTITPFVLMVDKELALSYDLNSNKLYNVYNHLKTVKVEALGPHIIKAINNLFPLRYDENTKKWMNIFIYALQLKLSPEQMCSIINEAFPLDVDHDIYDGTLLDLLSLNKRSIEFIQIQCRKNYQKVYCTLLFLSLLNNAKDLTKTIGLQVQAACIFNAKEHSQLLQAAALVIVPTFLLCSLYSILLY